MDLVIWQSGWKENPSEGGQVCFRNQGQELGQSAEPTSYGNGGRNWVGCALAQPKGKGEASPLKYFCQKQSCFPARSVGEGARLVQRCLDRASNEENFHLSFLAEKLRRGKHQACTESPEGGNR